VSRLMIVSDFEINLLTASFKSVADSPFTEVDSAPFAAAQTMLLNPEAHDPSETARSYCFWTQPQALISALGDGVDWSGIDQQQASKECEIVADALIRLSRKAQQVYWVMWEQPVPLSGQSDRAWSVAHGAQYIIQKLNCLLAERLAQESNIICLDSNRWIQHVGQHAYCRKTWYMAKLPFNPAVYREAAETIADIHRQLIRGRHKVLILDLDNTLWGGVIGDDGLPGIRLGGHDPVGEAFQHVQRWVLAQKRQGVILAIVSKNEDQVALEAMNTHADMLIRPSDCAVLKINWRDKAENIGELLAELNLTPDAAVFIDDHPAERARVAEAFPEMTVVDLPADPLRYCDVLLSLNCFQGGSVTPEDLTRTDLYQQEAMRQSLRGQASTQAEWLSSLLIEITCSPCSEVDAPRVIQLINKTNQMNLRTRRLSDTAFETWLSEPDHELWTFRLKDRFGDAGLIGVVSWSIQDGILNIEDFLLSCRVFGREVERAMVAWVVARAEDAGCSGVQAHFIETKKNKPCWRFWSEQSGFSRDGNVFQFDVRDQRYPWPDHLKLNQESALRNGVGLV
jgi:FkbH-like protein